MDVFRMLVSALVGTIPNNRVQQRHVDVSAVPANLNREMLYESFMPINALVFISETTKLSRDTLVDFARKTVLAVKSLLLEDPECFSQFDNYQSKVRVDDERLQSALEARNKYLDADHSMIARGMVQDKYKLLKARGGLSRLYYEDEDQKYLEMLERLMHAKYESDGISRAVQREKTEFYGEKAYIPQSAVLDARVSLSLGGSIFMPGLLATVAKNLGLPNKEEQVGNALGKVLAPVEELLSRMHLKSFTEKKTLVLDFLQGCLRRKDGVFKEKIDRGFEERSKLLQIYFKNDPKAQSRLRELDRLQEEEINRLIAIFRNIREEDLVLRLDKPVVQAYSNLLGYGQRAAKDALYDLFR